MAQVTARHLVEAEQQIAHARATTNELNGVRHHDRELIRALAQLNADGEAQRAYRESKRATLDGLPISEAEAEAHREIMRRAA